MPPEAALAQAAAHAAKPSPELSRREAGKAERRHRIIEAARQLIRETGNVGLSMRALASRAGVSLATPYNLFGSKRAIILALLEDVREFHGRFAAVKTSDPLERLFAAFDMAVEFYVNDPSFYKTLWAAVFDTSDEVRGAVLNSKADIFWMQLLDTAFDAGALQPNLDRKLVHRHLMHIFHAAMLDWVVGEVGSKTLSPMLSSGLALVLLGAASPEWRGPLQARLLEAQARLAPGGLISEARKPLA